MTDLTGVFIDAVTGDQIQRELTVEEKNNYDAICLAVAEGMESRATNESARQSALAKLADLGLTQDEINAL
jgi:hypothetical protein